MDQVWQMEDAINHFNDIINSAMHHKIQIIELKNHQKVMVILMEDFENAVKPKNSLVDFFRQSPLYDLHLDLERNKDVGREIIL